MKIILATTNEGKLRELRALLKSTPFEVLSLSDFPEIPEPPETGDTFEANALQKALFVLERTGLPTLAEDSGLVVDALDGAPGVWSKRYSPEQTTEANNSLLLSQLEHSHTRTARLHCVLAFATPTDAPRTFEGTLEGCIVQAPKRLRRLWV